MELIESIKSLDFSRFGLIGSVIAGLFFVIIKVLMMFDKYNERLLEIIDENQEEPRKSWIEQNRESK
jgi:hypothetical protein